MSVEQARKELDEAMSRLDIQCDVTQLAVNQKGGISKEKVRALIAKGNSAVIAYYRFRNEEARANGKTHPENCLLVDGHDGVCIIP